MPRLHQVKIIDVRTPEEYLFVRPSDHGLENPRSSQKANAWRPPKKKQFPHEALLDFVSRVGEVAQPDDTLMVMCRSGEAAAPCRQLPGQGRLQECLQHC